VAVQGGMETRNGGNIVSSRQSLSKNASVIGVPPHPDQTVLTIENVMFLLQIHRTRAYEIIAAHELAHYRMGKSIRVPIEAVEEYKAQRLIKARPLNGLTVVCARLQEQRL